MQLNSGPLSQKGLTNEETEALQAEAVRATRRASDTSSLSPHRRPTTRHHYQDRMDMGSLREVTGPGHVAEGGSGWMTPSTPCLAPLLPGPDFPSRLCFPRPRRLTESLPSLL